MKRNNQKKSCLTIFWRLLKRYLANCSIHGLKYLVQEDCHWSERIFWFISCALSWWGCSIMIAGVINEHQSRRVATTVETNYLGWPSYFPSLHFCSNEESRYRKFTSTTWPKVGGLLKVVDILWWGYKERMPPPHNAEIFLSFMNMTVMNCEDLFENCTLNGETLNCCEIIRPLWTPVGHCLAFNSIHTDPSEGERLRLPVDQGGILVISFRDTPFGVALRKSTTLYVLDRLDLPSILTTGERKVMSKWTQTHTQIDITQEPTYNEDGVRAISVNKRQCRFSNEAEDLLYFKKYSYEACLAEDMMRRMIEVCGCVTHILPRPPEMPACDYSGLSCINKNSVIFTNSTNVTCSADCEEITFEYFSNFLKDSKRPTLTVNLLFSPTIRYRRYIVHSMLDVVVAMGSAVGLFVGASTLSLVEIPYWFIVRGFDDDNDYKEK